MLFDDILLAEISVQQLMNFSLDNSSIPHDKFSTLIARYEVFDKIRIHVAEKFIVTEKMFSLYLLRCNRQARKDRKRNCICRCRYTYCFHIWRQIWDYTHAVFCIESNLRLYVCEIKQNNTVWDIITLISVC